MGYTFSLKKNVHMYNHLLTISDGKNTYEAIVETMPTKEEAVAVWLEDFQFPEETAQIIKTEMAKWFSSQNIRCVFQKGRGR